MTQILVLDIAGNPMEWVSPAEAAHSYVTGRVAWDLGREEIVLRGGQNRDGHQSLLAIKPVIAISGSGAMMSRVREVIPLGDDNRALFGRDRYCCGYCGQVYRHHDLSRDHILARCRGGQDTWTNCVTACKVCNQAKGHLLVEQFKPLLYLPYVPCRNEHFILSGRSILADQMEYLAARLPQHSRVAN
jgi:hypothetical protein